MNARDYEQYGITKKRFKAILDNILTSDIEDLQSIVNVIDPDVTRYLLEHIYYNISFDKLCDMYLLKDGTMIPYSKSSFYRKKRLLFHIIDEQMRSEEEKNYTLEGQMDIFDFIQKE